MGTGGDRQWGWPSPEHPALAIWWHRAQRKGGHPRVCMAQTKPGLATSLGLMELSLGNLV